MDKPDYSGNKTGIEQTLSQKIALSFFPLEIQDFSFSVFRCPVSPDDRKKSWPDCSRRKLPLQVAGEDEKYGDYWVSYKYKKGFEEFVCQHEDNLYLTNDILYQALVYKCTQNLIPETEYIVRSNFRSRPVFFTLSPILR